MQRNVYLLFKRESFWMVFGSLEAAKQTAIQADSVDGDMTEIEWQWETIEEGDIEPWYASNKGGWSITQETVTFSE